MTRTPRRVPYAANRRAQQTITLGVTTWFRAPERVREAQARTASVREELFGARDLEGAIEEAFELGEIGARLDLLARGFGHRHAALCKDAEDGARPLLGSPFDAPLREPL